MCPSSNVAPTLDDHTLVRELGSGGHLFWFGAQSLASVAPVSGVLAAALVLRHGGHLCARAAIHARGPAANVTGATLQRVLTFLAGGVPELRFTTESARALTVVYPTAVLGLVQFATLDKMSESDKSDNEECTNGNLLLLHVCLYPISACGPFQVCLLSCYLIRHTSVSRFSDQFAFTVRKKFPSKFEARARSCSRF